MKTVLFACVHNAGRSQMAAAWFNALADRGRAVALSAGTDPGPHVHPVVLAAMREVAIDLSRATPTFLSEELVRRASLLITMGCGEACPVVPGVDRVDWPLPRIRTGSPSSACAPSRDDIRARVVELLETHGWASPALR